MAIKSGPAVVITKLVKAGFVCVSCNSEMPTWGKKTEREKKKWRPF